MKNRVGDRVHRAVRFFGMRLTLLFLVGVVVSAAFLNKMIFYLPAMTRVIVALVFMTFATGMIFSIAQFVTNAAFGIFEVFNRRYKVERTNDPDADRIADALHASRPKSINITDNPKVVAVTNSLTGVITVSRRVMQLLSREQLLAVITHEIAHLKHRKQQLAEIGLAALATVGFSLYFLNIILLVSPQMGALAEWAFLLLVLIPILRHGEVRADGDTRIVNLNNELAEALDILGKGDNPNEGSESHPATNSRIKRLLSPTPSVPITPSLPSSGLLDRFVNVNWEINFTTPKRYRSNGILYHVIEYAHSNGVGSLNILDVGCSKGVATRTLKADLQKAGIQAHTIGIDLSKKMSKGALRNLDEFHQVDILKTEQEALPLADVVICSYAAIFVTGERRYWIIRRCAEQLKENGVLVTNAFPFKRMNIPTPAKAFRYRVGALEYLRGGWRPFKAEFEKRRSEMAKSRTLAIAGRTAALEYAESIRVSWEKLDSEKKAVWKRIIVMTGWDFQLVRLLKYVISKLRSYAG